MNMTIAKRITAIRNALKTDPVMKINNFKFKRYESLTDLFEKIFGSEPFTASDFETDFPEKYMKRSLQNFAESDH